MKLASCRGIVTNRLGSLGMAAVRIQIMTCFSRNNAELSRRLETALFQNAAGCMQLLLTKHMDQNVVCDCRLKLLKLAFMQMAQT